MSFGAAFGGLLSGTAAPIEARECCGRMQPQQGNHRHFPDAQRDDRSDRRETACDDVKEHLQGRDESEAAARRKQERGASGPSKALGNVPGRCHLATLVAFAPKSNWAAGSACRT